MKSIKILTTIILTFAFYSYSYSIETVDKVLANLQKVTSYSADIKINVDISFVDIPDKEGKIYYQEPGKIKADIPGLAMLPKQGLGLDFKKILNDDTNAYIDGGETTLNGKKVRVIKAIPSNPESQIVLTSFWIDLKNFTVIQSEVTTKQNGTFLIELQHKKISQIAWLPVKVVINAKIPKLAIPKSFVSAKDKQKMEERGDDPESSTTNGVITITYDNYELNKELDKSIFDSDI